MTVSTDRLIPTVRAVYGSAPLPPPFDLLAAVHDLRTQAEVNQPTPAPLDRRAAAKAKKIAALLAAPDALELATGIASGATIADKHLTYAETMLGQLLIGQLAEQAFELIYRNTLGTTELTLEDQRESRNDTDYRVLNGGGRQVFRMNIKFHGARFRKAQEMVGLDPEDCFPLATYKINQGLQKQQKEILPYLFVIISSPISAVDVGKQLPRAFVQLAALAHASKAITGKRKLEERIVEHLIASPTPEVAELVAALRERLAAAPWRVISARKADKLLRDLLFERVFAVRVRGFTRNYRNAELDMHLSLDQDMTPLTRFLTIIREKGLHGATAELERGTI